MILTLVHPQVAVPDLVEASCDADILVFVIPHQFIGKVCDTIKGKIKSDALGISLIKVVRSICAFFLPFVMCDDSLLWTSYQPVVGPGSDTVFIILALYATAVDVKWINQYVLKVYNVIFNFWEFVKIVYVPELLFYTKTSTQEFKQTSIIKTFNI